MAKSKVELPSEEQVAAFIETYIPEPLASSFAALLNGMINLQQVEVDTGNDNEDDRPARGRGRGRAAEAENNNDDDAPPARGRGRGRAAAQENDNEDAPPARSARGGRGRAAASDDLLDDDDLLSNDDAAQADNNDDDAPPARRGGGRGRAAAQENNDDDAPPARRGRGPASRNDDNNDDDAPPARGRGRQAEPEPENDDDQDQGGDDQPITFEDLGGDEATVKEYTDTFMEGYKAKDIKADVLETWGITLKGTDVELLASQAAEIYVAMETLTALAPKKLEKTLADFGVEVDYGRTKSEKTKAVMAARALVEVALENFDA